MRIESVLNQSFQNFQLIIFDDHSTDNSVEIIEHYRFKEKVSDIVYNNNNYGTPFKVWQKAFDLCRGNYIWIAESDDYASEDFLKKITDVLLSDKEIGLVYCDSNIINSDGTYSNVSYKEIRNKTFGNKKWSTDYSRKGIDELEENLLFDCTINNMSSAVFKKDLLQHVDWESLLNFKYSGDWFFLILLVHRTKIYYLSDTLNQFRSSSNNFKNEYKSILFHYKERAMVRYYSFNILHSKISLSSRKKLYAQLGCELSILLNEVIKGKISKKDFFRSLLEIRQINPTLFKKHFFNMAKHYIKKLVRK